MKMILFSMYYCKLPLSVLVGNPPDCNALDWNCAEIIAAENTKATT
jgi:hypothetical protein